MLAVDSHTILLLCPDILIQSVPEANCFFAFNTRSGEHFRLNETAYWILEASGEGVLLGDLTRRFAQAFDLDSYNALRDVTETVLFALANDLIKEVSDEKKKGGISETQNY